MGGILTLSYKGKDNIGHLLPYDLSNFSRIKSLFHLGIIAWIPGELVTNLVVHHNTNDQEFGIGNLVNPVENLLSPLPPSFFYISLSMLLLIEQRMQAHSSLETLEGKHVTMLHLFILPLTLFL